MGLEGESLGLQTDTQVCRTKPDKTQLWTIGTGQPPNAKSRQPE